MTVKWSYKNFLFAPSSSESFPTFSNNPKTKKKKIFYSTDEFLGDGEKEGPGGEDGAVHEYLNNPASSISQTAPLK